MKNNKKFKICVITILSYNLISILNFLILYKKRNYITYKALDEELNDIQDFIDIVFNNTLIDGDKLYPLIDHPKITVIISVYNGEAYLNTSTLSIRNQDLKDIEIILVDDCSNDKSVDLIKELMGKDPRIVLYQNKENKGNLYTKAKGVLHAKGKYVFLLDEDDMLIQRDALSTLFREAEANNLDLLGFESITSIPKLSRIRYKRRHIERPIFFQPKLSEMMFKHDENGKIELIGGLLTNYLIKKNILIKVIKMLDTKLMNEKMNFHDDFVLFFLLTRNAYNLKQIDRIFYLVISGWNITDQKVKFRTEVKKRNYELKRCSSLLNFNEFILKNTKNTFYDKKIAFYCLDRFLLSYWCRKYKPTLDKAIEVSNLYLKNEFIDDVDKMKIKIFFDEIKSDLKMGI